MDKYTKDQFDAMTALHYAVKALDHTLIKYTIANLLEAPVTVAKVDEVYHLLFKYNGIDNIREFAVNPMFMQECISAIISELQNKVESPKYTPAHSDLYEIAVIREPKNGEGIPYLYLDTYIYPEVDGIRFYSRWENEGEDDEEFQIFINGEWQGVNSIDFE